MARRTSRADLLQPEAALHHTAGSSSQPTVLLMCWLLLASLIPDAAALTTTKTVGDNGNATPSPSGSSGSGAGEGSERGGDPKIRRLDPRIRPVLYRLTMRPFLGEGANFTFHGHVAITLSILPGAQVDSVVFHAKQLNISADEVTVTLADNRQTTTAINTGQVGAAATPVVVGQQADLQQETYTVRLSPALQPGTLYILSVPFRGQLQEATLTGFYRTSYQEEGRTKWIALTHFEATEARGAFPCFDEPALKARFQISIAHSSNYRALSNMPIERSEQMSDEPGWVLDHFVTSPPMSTYLVAFTVSEMVFETADETNPLLLPDATSMNTSYSGRRQHPSSAGISGTAATSRTSVTAHEPQKALAIGQGRDSHLAAVASSPSAGQQKRTENTAVATNMTNRGSPVKIRLLVRPNFRDRAKYVLTIAPKVLQFYADYFESPYPLPKLDFTAVPDFFYGGMENWGAVNYWDDRILVGPETSSDSLQRAAIHIVHEFSHQWFGDLVTPVWFSETWLKEGFATFCEYLATNFVEPTWDMPDKLLGELHRVMRQDSTRFTRPAFNTVETAAQIIEVFDSISYTKGAGLYRMLNFTLTENVFRKGVAIFIHKWKYLNAAHDDFYQAMQKAIDQSPTQRHILPANTTLKQVMDSWILQPGFPVVTATRNYVTGSLTIKQARFTIDGRPLANSSSQTWYVPVSYQTQNEVTAGTLSTIPRVWLGVSDERRSVTVRRVLPRGTKGATQWLLINLQQAGFYKVNYDVDNWNLLVHQLATNPLLLPAATRAQLISDAFSLARAGALSYSITLNLTRYLRDSHAEFSYVPWQAFLEDTQFLQDVLYVTRSYSHLKRYMLSLLEPLIHQLRIEPKPGDTLPTKQLRGITLSRLIWLQSRNMWAHTYFAQWMASPNNYMIPVDLRPAVFCAAVMKGSDTEFNFLMGQLNNVTMRTLRNELLSGLMCSQEQARIAMLLNAPLEGKTLNLLDATAVWQAVPRNPAAHTVAFDYIREQWSNLTVRFPDTDFPINDMLDGATAGLSTQKQLDDLKAFKDSHEGQFNFTPTTIERAIESLQEKISWRQRFESSIAEWLNSPASGLPRQM